MTDIDPLAQAEAEAEILRLVRELAQATIETTEISEEAAEADVTYDIAHAHALLIQRGHDGTVPEKQAKALLDTEDEYREARLTEARAKAAYEKGRNIRASLDALRSINANIRPLVAR